MCLCICSTDFYHSSLVRENIADVKLRTALNQALENTALEYGGLSYRSERVNHIRRECLRKNTSSLLHRLWPQLNFVSTAIGSSFALYKKEIEYYCGEKLPLINLPNYGASEGLFGTLASIHTDEYFLSPILAFFEFIKEEDINQVFFIYLFRFSKYIVNSIRQRMLISHYDEKADKISTKYSKIYRKKCRQTTRQ